MSSTHQHRDVARGILNRLGEAVLIGIPIGEKGPKTHNWQKTTLADMSSEYLDALDSQNIGVLVGTPSNHLISIDADSDAFLEDFLAVNPNLNECLITKGSRGGNVWLRIDGDYPRKVLKIKTMEGQPWGEWRADGGQTVIWGIHPETKKSYTSNQKKLLTIKFDSINWPAGLLLPWVENVAMPVPIESPIVDRARAYVIKMPPAVSGQCGHDALFNVAKKLTHDFDLPQREAMNIMTEYNTRCVPPWSEKELLHKLEDASKCNRSTIGRGTLAGRPLDFKTPAKRIEISSEEPDAPILWKGISAPTLSEVALYGIAGEIIRQIEPHTETHPASLLLQLLVGVGNLVGGGPHFITERDKQHANLFVAIVGDSARGRKGTSWGHIRFLLEQTDEQWATNRIKGGLASGEGVIAELQDPPMRNEQQEEELRDKRLLLMEGELAQLLQVMSRAGNTIATIMRNAWDTGFLNNMSKGKPLKASHCHISMIGHITSTELRKLLSQTDSANGFANRYLWVHSARTKLLPDGGELHNDHFSKEINTLQEIAVKSRGRGQITRSPKAREYWHSIYPELTQETPGLWGQVTSRAEAQVVRLALLFCLMDLSEHIEVEHLQAAKAVWDYCFQSARWAFEEFEYSKAARDILEALQGGSLTRTQISHGVFKKHIKEGELDAALKEIENKILIEIEPTKGKSRTIYSLKND